MPTLRFKSPAWLYAGLGALPVFVWWLGWYPGFSTSDTVDQFTQIQNGTFYNHHAAIHTLYLSVLSGGGSEPGLVGLFQVLVFGMLLAYAAKWLIRAGVPTWLTVTAAIGLGLSPAVAPTTLALWKDIPFGLLFLWAWIELFALAVDRDRASSPWPGVRLGLAMAGLWTLRGNGAPTVAVVLIALLWSYRKQLRTPLITMGTAAAAVLLIVGPLYTGLDVEDTAAVPAQVFLPDVAASYSFKPWTFTADDVALMEAVAPLDIWVSRYDCDESTWLLFDPQFNQQPVRESPDLYLGLEVDVFLRDFESVFNHRRCAGNYVYWPPQPADAYFHRAPFEAPENELGLDRDPLVEAAFDATLPVYEFADQEEVLWLTWRPAIVIVPALVAVLVFASIPRGRRFLLPSALFVAHIANLVATSPTQDFRYAYPVYLTGVLTLTLLWPTLRPQSAGASPQSEPETVRTPS